MQRLSPLDLSIGGPCAGKTTALERVRKHLEESGFRVFTVPEVATLFFANGATVCDPLEVQVRDFSTR